uniref:Iron-binding zinc finger CDGSH type domain-containing protein n=1 Tax=Gouania willdenowi TaxID=441366 RepID=A0A8C5D6P7_GOUWI
MPELHKHTKRFIQLQQNILESSQPVSAARLPCRVKVSAGRRYAWCACGHSKKQPFCDGAHKASAPDISPLRFTPDKDQTVLLCACKQTKNAPYCDGSHFKVIYRDDLISVCCPKKLANISRG